MNCAWILLSIVCFSILTVLGQRTHLDAPQNIKLLRAFRQWTTKVIGRTGKNEELLEHARNLKRIQDYISTPFPCDVSNGRSPKVPKTVHELRPGDIDVIGAMGDSLTAGNGVFASNILHVLMENRGVVATGGGQGNWRMYLTLPNILKEFNPNLIGFATSDAFTYEKASEFNVAEGGAMSRDIPYMAQALINRMKSDPRVDLKKHWKMVSIMIGANDFCTDMCYLPKASDTLYNHKKDLLQALRLLKSELPRTFVSVIPPPHLQLLVNMTGRSAFCEITVDFECSCLLGLTFRDRRQAYYDIMAQWHKLEEEIAMYPEFQTNDFAVVIQPFTTNLTFPETSDGKSDFSYLSSDCFHISQKGNARVSNALWNNLLQAVGAKSRNWKNTFEEFLCPTERRPFIATPKNSNIKM
ncbi:hypothetical protein TKK_0005929 [Trichogramma kaykai]|uniref:Phospholipase B1, membrane-associated n=1 Tax=Trichogramma kaykai TaxID=54128 RepID=A0ABD2XFR3_9HYME